ncbi:MAG: hypothetical protein JW715_16050 [Sedimentisphaerales bacterium]|nr:hypothetical protein [Sedimentisphaerales bacterium]
MIFFARIISLINTLTNSFGKLVLAPVESLPGWLSNTIISAIAGVLLLIVFKYTSNQQAIGKIRDDIKANMLALKLFKDSISVTLLAEVRVFKGAFLLLLYSIVPMLVMIIPVSLLIAQMSLWYQLRPLRQGETAVVTAKLNGNIEENWPTINIEPTSAIEVTVGPVRIFSKREICWEIKALENGKHNITFDIAQDKIEKELAIGDSYMRVSAIRPALNWVDILMHPAEKPFGSDSVVQSVSIDYPERRSKTSGTDWWLIYFFIASMVFAFLSKPFLKVRI